MAIPAKPTLTAPPTAPVRGEDRASFATKANAYVVFIGTNVTDLTAAIDWQNTVFTATETEATNAAQSVVDAAAEATDASESLDQTIATAALYTVRHQGAHATAPATRNDGSALQAGDFYFNTSVLKTFTWDGE
jgi:hypothetical protein